MNNVRYADDTVVFPDSVEGLQELMTRIANAGKTYGLETNIKISKYLVISKNSRQSKLN